MAWRYPQSITTTSTVALDLGETDSATVARNVFVASEQNIGISAAGSFQRIDIRGSVAGAYAVRMGNQFGSDEGNRLKIQSTGEILSYNYAIGI